jgi:hypothetical protein
LSAGEIILPVIEFAYFDPEAGEYRTLRSDTTRIAVSGSSSPGARASLGTLQPERLDIRYAKARFGPLRQATPPFHRTAFFQTLMWAPLVVVPGLIAVGRWRIRRRSDRGRARSRAARARARRRLRTVEKRTGTIDGATFHEEVARALVDYVADRFDRSPSGLTYDLADSLLVQRGVAEDLRRDFRRCLEACDFARYVPSSGTDERRRELLGDARSLVERLESSL